MLAPNQLSGDRNFECAVCLLALSIASVCQELALVYVSVVYTCRCPALLPFIVHSVEWLQLVESEVTHTVAD